MNENNKPIAPGRALFKQLTRALDEQYAKICATHSLKPSYVDILFLLLQGEPMSPAEIADTAGLSQATCNLFLRDLEATCWISFDMGGWTAAKRAEDFREDIVQTVLAAEAYVTAHLPEVFGQAVRS